VRSTIDEARPSLWFTCSDDRFRSVSASNRYWHV